MRDFGKIDGDYLVWLLNRTTAFAGRDPFFLISESRLKFVVGINVRLSYTNEYYQEYTQYVDVKITIMRSGSIKSMTYGGQGAWVNRTGNNEWLWDEMTINVENALELKRIRTQNPNVTEI